MKEQARRKFQKTSTCPDCQRTIPTELIKQHIDECQKYVPTYINNIRRVIPHASKDYLHFLISEMDIIKEQLIQKAKSDQKKEEFYKQISEKRQINGHKKQEKMKEVEKEEKKDKKQENIQKKQQKVENVPHVDQTLALEDLLGSNDPFKEPPPSSGDNIQCADPQCRNPVKAEDIERFTYLEQCLHTMCKYCFRNYVRNNYVKKKGELKCPSKGCKHSIIYIQIKELLDSSVLTKLQKQLNSKAFHLIQCQKCHEQYQFEKGKVSDAPKKTEDGKPLPQSKAKHYAENRFQCPKCRQEQCQSCKQTPYHIGFDCQEFKQHKSKKKCRYCRNPLPKGYMSESGIISFDDICDSAECSAQMKVACSKKLPCGHNCSGFIREKNCLPCLKEECALKNQKQLHGENQNSYCNLCFIQSLGQAPCIQSKCGHIFHLKCLQKRLELKWGTPRITFRFCECPLCNHWMEVPAQSSVSKQLIKFKILEEKVKQKALKRLKHENEDKDGRLTDPKSQFYKKQQKYAMTIYAYFICYECQEPFFGGRKSCAQAMNEPKDGQKFDPKDLICPSCCPIQVTDCKKHGKDFISFKCRFCCSVAQWFCWGNTHFCDQCHKKQISGKYVSRMSKDKLPRCEGKGKCPVGGQHGGNGDQFCLGCGICRGQKLDARDF